jgi:antitoxin VapB
MDTTRIFRSGNSQAVRLPKEYRMEGEKVYIKRVGEIVLLIPYAVGWDVLFDSLSMFSEDFMEAREQPEIQVREDAFE